MTTTDTRDTTATVDQAERLADAGCEIVRITAPSITDAENLSPIADELHRRGVRVPLVADIHFTPQAAMLAVEHVEKVRINPGNYADRKRFEQRDYTDAEYRTELERIAERFVPLVLRARELGVSVRDVVAMVLGGHGDSMVPLPRFCSVAGVPLRSLMDDSSIDAIVKRVQGAGGEVVGLLKTGSAFVSPAQASIEMAEAVLLDQKRVLPCAAYLEGEYGASGIYMGVPVQLGAGGVERIFELELDKDERALLDGSIEHVKTLLAGITL